MVSTIEQMTSVEECDALSSILQLEKDDVQLRLLQAERNQRNLRNGNSSIKAELQTLDAQIAALDALIPSLPEGEIRMEQERQRRAADYRRYLLQNRQGNYSLLALAIRDLEVANATSRLAEVEAGLSAVAAHRSGL
jgi:multidrug resistance efflux pump